jgi:hypothetical protein
MEESAVHVATDVADIPQNKGGAIPGHFDHKADHDCVTGYTYSIPLQAGWYGNELIIAIHAVVTGPEGQTETAWTVNCGDIDGPQQLPGSSWGFYVRLPANAWN